MRRFPNPYAAIVAIGIGLLVPGARAQSESPLGGAWTLNRSLSDMPREIGFDIAALAAPAGAGRGGATGRGRVESYDESRRIQFLTNEARNPSTRLTIVDTPAAVTMTNDVGQSRVLHPNVRDESIEVEGVRLIANTKRDGDRLVVAYYVSDGREVRYIYSRSSTPSQLVVDVEFRQRGAEEKARRVYEPAIASNTAAPPAPAASAPSSRPAAVPAAPVPASGTQDTFDARPGAELRGLKTLGILVEQLSTQAVGCGLNHDAIEAALSKRLSDGGFTVRRNSDEDTYVYVNVMTTTLSTGTCVSRYDAFLYTHATANLSYRDRPVLVQVSLMHRGGLGSSPPTGHAAAVTRGLEEYVELFMSQIRDANR